MEGSGWTSGIGAMGSGGAINDSIQSTTSTYSSSKIVGLIGVPGSGSAAASGNTYKVEIARWGITTGFPTKRIEVIASANVMCYADAEYTRAYNNIIGLNNAFNWAKAAGYYNVIVPNGNYPVCYSNISSNDKENMIVIDQDYFSVDLNFSTFKVIYDSSKRSPYDKVAGATSADPWVTNTALPYLFEGVFMSVRDCNYTEVKNGIVIGDKIDRSFTDPGEAANNNSYGITAGGACKYVNIEGNDVSLFMGDGITMSGSKKNVGIKNGYDLGFVSGDLDPNTGAQIASTTRCVSTLWFSVSPSAPHFWQGYGESQGMSYLGSRRITAYMYDVNKVFLTKETVMILREFITTKKTAFVKFVVDEAIADPGGWSMQLQRGLYGSFITFQKNYIHHNHRGGSSPGVNDMLIADNFYYKNGEWYDYDNDLIGFQSSATRYHINMEDAQGYNIRVIGNRFEGGRLGVAARGYDWIIKDNYFSNCSVAIYRLQYLTLKDNYFEGPGGGFDVFYYDTPWNNYQDYIRYWDIEGNVFEGDFSIQGNAVVKNISDNTIWGIVNLGCDVENFRNNRFKLDTDVGTGYLVDINTVSKMYNCSFIKSKQSKTLNMIRFKNTVLTNCTFKNIKIHLNNVTVKDSTIIDSGFNLRDTNGDLYTPVSVKFDGCTVNQGTYTILNPYGGDYIENSSFIMANEHTPVTLELTNCDIISTSSQNIISSQGNVNLPLADIKIKGTSIKKQLNSNIGLGYIGGIFDISKSTISSDVVVPTITPNSAYIHTLDAILTNVSFSKSPLTSAPTYGIYAQGQTVPNPVPASGGYMGYVCTTSGGGVANNSSWASRTSFPMRARINTLNHVYEAQNAGSSAPTIPTFPTTAMAIVPDSAGIATWSGNAVYAVGSLVVPTTANGFYYSANVGGTSAATQPVWSTTATTTDGTVTWTNIPIITWKEIGVLASFRPYGLIG